MARIGPRLRRASVGPDPEPVVGPLPDDEEEEEEEPQEPTTSLDELQSEADAQQFDRTFLARSGDFRIEGQFSPAPFPLQVIPRVAYTINYNMVYNEERDRWEPDTGNDSGGGHVRLFDDGAPTYSGGQTTQVTFVDAEASAPFEASPGDDAITVPEDGDYILAAGIILGNAVDEQGINVQIRRNGTQLFEGGNAEEADGDIAGNPGGVVALDEGDSITLTVAVTGANNVTGFGSPHTAYLTAGRL